MNFLFLENARVEEQKGVMHQILKDGVCPFCADHLETYHKKPIHAEGKYWILTENQWPYDDTKNHLLAITKEHVESLSDLDPQAGAELFDLFRKAMKEFSIDGGTLAMRFGTIARPASTVRHLHAHLIEPDSSKPDHKGVKFAVSKPSQKSPEAA
ncbi:HIT domain-containing protein [Candidatus Parcubacteria bacterium]|nr:HIT domain-containing protein [Candidatus Parcubacteria bacterium]